MKSLIIFASGTGTNTQAIVNHFRLDQQARIALIVTNNPAAGVLKIAETEGIPSLVINRDSFKDERLIETLRAHNPSLLVLAGFLWKIPARMVEAFPGKIVNIHPALLPAFGGKGMYGEHVHKAVIASRSPASGITIHYVNEHYDAGDIIVQAHCPVRETDDTHSLAERVHQLEHFFYPRTLEFLLG